MGVEKDKQLGTCRLSSCILEAQASEGLQAGREGGGSLLGIGQEAL